MMVTGLHIILLVVLTVDSRCPSLLDCVMERREKCVLDSDKCGPCRPQFEETKSGKCIFKERPSKFMGPDSIIDLIQEHRMNKGHRINSTPAASTTTSTAGSPVGTSVGFRPQLQHNTTVAGTPPPLVPTSASQMKETKMGRRRKSEINQTMSLTLIIICSLTALSGILVAALCWYRLQKEVRLAQEMAYKAYKGSRQHPCQRPSADQMSQYIQHYSSQKKHFQVQESCRKPCPQLSTDSEADAEEFDIYECPGLAPTGEMEIHNPLFDPSRTDQ
ncbi:neural proliferation differentiation and control protein 1-like isoform X2 [Pseudophryne corroboree]|uniref:neural proliferation differentiation and control protein 1-like isoform X2 n=1 Tax=Pseudophryne corroboree TaxID=495146 RepID=UPI00308211B0